MKPEDKFPLIFECCQIVRGHSRSIICDLQRYAYVFIPNDLADLLVNSRGQSLESIKELHHNSYDDTIQENFDILESLEFLFYTNHPNWFPKMSMDWHEPVLVNNAIIDLKDSAFKHPTELWEQLSNLGCEHVQLRIFDKTDLSELERLLISIGTKRIVAVEIICPYLAEIQEEQLIKFVFQQPRVSELLMYSAPEDKLVYISDNDMGTISFLSDAITNQQCCGQISSQLFAVNIPTFTESHHHNSCLNRKISIDVEGNIKNCPSMSQSFGNIKDTTLQEALDHPDFKKYWNVTKDQIAVCKDCEFRYICTDCRAYIETPEDMYSKPLKCGYNPYTCEWEEWSTNPLKQKAIDHYGMREVLPEFKMKPDYAPATSPGIA